VKVLVTGGSGFIGSHVIDCVRAAGHEPRIFDLVPSPSPMSPRTVSTNVVADPANAALVAIMATRLRELDPGWTGSAQAARLEGAAGPDYMDDDALE